MKEEKDFRIYFEKFLSDILYNHVTIKLHNDTKANWILGVSALVMGLSLPHIKNGMDYADIGYAVIFVSSLISFLFSLIIFDPPDFLTKSKHSAKSLMYCNKNIDPEKYSKNLKKIKTCDALIEQYAYDIANIVNRNIMVKNKLIRWPTYILFFGLAAGSSMILALVLQV